MNRIFHTFLFFILILAAAGCRRQVPYSGPEIEKPVVQVYAKYPAGSDLQVLMDDFGLNNAVVRYRGGLSGGRFSAVYFLEEGNLHVEAQETENGHNRLQTTPYIEPAEGSIEERVSKWDGSTESPYPDGKY